jgi:trigger factor
MNIEVQSENAFARKVNVTIAAERVRQELDQAFRQVGRRARLPGFRAGKVPRRVLEARFGASVRDDVASSLIQEAYRTAMADHKLEPVSQPSVVEQGDLQPGTAFSFTIAMDVRPEVTAAKYTGLDVYWPQWEVSDKDVDEALEQRRESQRRLSVIEGRAVEAGDRVQVKLSAKDGDDEVVSEPGTMISTEGEIWFKGLEGALIGLENGGSLEQEVTFADDARNEAVQGRTLQVTLEVLGIQAEVVPEMSDDLAKEMGFDDGVAGLRASLRDELSKGREAGMRNQARANLLQALIESNDFAVPAGMVEQNLQLLTEELKLQQAYAGRDPRSVTFSAEQLAELRIRAGFAAKGGLLLESVSTSENITVSDDDLEAKYVELAEGRGQSVEAIKGFFVKDDAVDELRDRLLEEKTLDWLLDNANVSHEAPQVDTPIETSAVTEDAPASETAAESSDKAASTWSMKNTKAELLAAAKAAGVEVKSSWKKDKILAALTA